MSMLGKRFKIEATLNPEEHEKVQKYIESKGISIYALIRRSIFTYMRKQNSTIDHFIGEEEPEDQGEDQEEEEISTEEAAFRREKKKRRSK